MPVHPIEARCRRCNADFHLFELRDQRRGTCPRCGSPLTPDWDAVLIAESARADAAQRALVASLRRLRNLPGNLAVKPHSVIRNLFEEVGWHHDLVADGMVHDEVTRLRRLVDRWADLETHTRRPAARSWTRRIASRFVADIPPARPARPAAAAT